jgi:SAM-dependent methyltransferase
VDYLAFEDRHRGPSRDIKDKQRDYLQYFRGSGRVLDAGCGRGEFLELLAEAGIDAYGVEASPQMAALCREKGMAVEVDDINAHLAGLPDDSLGGIFSAQVVEHLTTEAVLEFVRLARAKLVPGGRLVIETLNPACVAVHTGALYLDLSHTKPVHPEAMRFLLEAAPFAGVQLLWRSPFPEELRLKEGRFFYQLQKFEEALLGLVNENFRRLNYLIYGYQDYAVVGTK